MIEEVNLLTQKKDKILRDLKENLVKAQAQMKAYEINPDVQLLWPQRPVTLTTCDQVYLKFQPYRL